MFGEPTRQHEWLTQILGDWIYSSECDMGEGKPRERFDGRERVIALGPFWVIAEGEGEMPGGGVASTRMTLGHDPARGFCGTWIGSMMPSLWIYEGKLSDDGRSLTLAADGPSMAGAGRPTYEDVITLIGPDERMLTSRIQAADGTWKEFVWSRYRRA